MEGIKQTLCDKLTELITYLAYFFVLVEKKGVVKQTGTQTNPPESAPVSTWTAPYGKRVHLFYDCTALTNRVTRSGLPPDKPKRTDVCQYCQDRWSTGLSEEP